MNPYAPPSPSETPSRTRLILGETVVRALAAVDMILVTIWVLRSGEGPKLEATINALARAEFRVRDWAE